VDPSLDAYVVAQSLPEMLVQIFMLGALAQLLVPALAGQVHERGEAEAARFSGRILGLIALASCAITLGAGLLAGPLIRLMAPGFDAERHDWPCGFSASCSSTPLGVHLLRQGAAAVPPPLEPAATSAGRQPVQVASSALGPRHGGRPRHHRLNAATVSCSFGLAALPARSGPAPRWDEATGDSSA
jgi:hypothetical protein